MSNSFNDQKPRMKRIIICCDGLSYTSSPERSIELVLMKVGGSSGKQISNCLPSIKPTDSTNILVNWQIGSTVGGATTLAVKNEDGDETKQVTNDSYYEREYIFAPCLQVLFSFLHDTDYVRWILFFLNHYSTSSCAIGVLLTPGSAYSSLDRRLPVYISFTLWRSEPSPSFVLLARTRTSPFSTELSLSEHVHEAYAFLAHNHHPGKTIHLFGFSCRAYTARSIRGLVCRIDILMKKGLRRLPNQEVPHPPLDTVRLLGIPSISVSIVRNWIAGNEQEKYSFHDTDLSPCVDNAFHALALNEHHGPFTPMLCKKTEDTPTNLKQFWFPLVHTNIGGVYDDQVIADMILTWMIQQLLK
ncbi:hypothetical protein L873DRAFT_1848772 [Choiromyces venosus 120613-1]|uniref:T6SS Phospholipase effector Tle1-like catalytic domain-containing protein n=1 Tax=Choiromyces venosus 120613-1 TaxID=1336337 RepID=A0A3N4IX86_9PEZI|nr:hypothetical protein L873DRAFT_1848772 [Choiromyces venosus 120613-1]